MDASLPMLPEVEKTRGVKHTMLYTHSLVVLLLFWPLYVVSVSLGQQVRRSIAVEDPLGQNGIAFHKLHALTCPGGDIHCDCSLTG